MEWKPQVSLSLCFSISPFFSPSHSLYPPHMHLCSFYTTFQQPSTFSLKMSHKNVLRTHYSFSFRTLSHPAALRHQGMILPHQHEAHESTESTCLPTKHNSLKSVDPISNMNRIFFGGSGRENTGIAIYQAQISIDNRSKQFCPSLAKWDRRFIWVTYRDTGDLKERFCRWQLRKAASLVLPTWLVGSSSGQNLFFTATGIVPTALVRGFCVSCLSLSFLCLVCIFYFLHVMSIPALSGKCSYFQEIVTQ